MGRWRCGLTSLLLRWICGTARIVLLLAVLAGVANAQETRHASLFTAALKAAQDAIGPSIQNVAVDPRPFVADSSLSLAAVRSGALADAPAEAARRRAALEDAGIPEGDAIADAKCVLAPGNGTPPPPDPNLPPPPPRPRTACNRAYATLAFSLPRSGGVIPEGLRSAEEGSEATPAQQIIRTVLLLPHGFLVYDFSFDPLPTGGWTLVEKRLRDGILS